MDRPYSRQGDISRIYYRPAQGGSRAVFLVEARLRKEVRQIRELFDMVGQLAEVVPISSGAVMSYAVQVQGDTSLFGKIEWLIKAQFTFSVVERNFSEVTFQLVRGLCEDADAQMAELPNCGICGAADPFPTRATVEWDEGDDPLYVSYCGRCSERHRVEDPARFITGLIRRDTRCLRLGADTPVIRLPDIVERQPGRGLVIAAAG